MGYVVFSQDPKGLPEIERLASHATRFFGATLETLQVGDGWVRVRLASSRSPPFDTSLTIRVRSVTREDLNDAKDAEARGRAAGMSTLAERCPMLLEIEPSEGAEATQAACLTITGICASVALGPVLPPDHSTLFGVRGAMERLALLG